MRNAKIRNITNKTLAIPMAEPAIPVNPNSAATIAITKNVADQPNILNLLSFVHNIEVDKCLKAFFSYSLNREARQAVRQHP